MVFDHIHHAVPCRLWAFLFVNLVQPNVEAMGIAVYESGNGLSRFCGCLVR
jgi:uncharacterized protein YhhL (DUF1145 family)